MPNNKLEFTLYGFVNYPVDRIGKRYNILFAEKFIKEAHNNWGVNVALEWINQNSLGNEEIPPFVGGGYYADFLNKEVKNSGNILHDDHFILINNNTKKFYVIDFQDGPQITKVLSSTEGFLGSACCMYSSEWNAKNIENHQLVVPGFYFPMFPEKTERKYHELKGRTPTDERIFFAGTIGDEKGMSYTRNDGKARRIVVRTLAEKYPDKIRMVDRHNKFPREEWWEETTKHWINLSIPGHPWCNRDFELWGLGRTIMASRWINPMPRNPIPNRHYLAASGGVRDHTGAVQDEEYAADRFAQLYDQAIADKDHLKDIGRWGKVFYERHLKMEQAVKYYCELVPWWQLSQS